MRVSHQGFWIGCVAAALFGISTIASASVIGVVDYSDTFTLNSTRTDGYYAGSSPVVDPVYNIEFARVGLPSVQWFNPGFSFNSPSTAVAEYPGSAGNPGAATGMAQDGGGHPTIGGPGDFGISYGQRTDYVVQVDANWGGSADRIDINSFPTNSTQIGGAVSVFFRRAGTPYPEISLFNGTETSTGFSTGLASGDTSWHNFGVRFNQPNHSLSFYVDASLKGTLDLATFAGGAYASYSNAAVGVGSNRFGWFDNFQVGSAIPEPTGLIMLATGLAGLLAYAWRKRR
jgi:hypothetical protein